MPIIHAYHLKTDTQAIFIASQSHLLAEHRLTDLVPDIGESIKATTVQFYSTQAFKEYVWMFTDMNSSNSPSNTVVSQSDFVFEYTKNYKN